MILLFLTELVLEREIKKFPMKTKKNEFSSKKGLLSTSFKSKHLIELDISKENFLKIITLLIEILDKEEVFSDKPLCNIQGREKAYLGDLESVFDISIHNKELLLIKGSIPSVDETDFSDNSNWDDFFLRITSEFFEFKGNHKILNKTHTKKANLPNSLSVSEIVKTAPLKIDYIRIGLEYFKSKNFTSILGFAPILSEYAYIEATEEKLIYESYSACLKKKDVKPFENNIKFKDLLALINKE